MRTIILGMLLILAVACQKNDLKMYSGRNTIQMADVSDSLTRYSFYFQEENVKEDTIWIQFRTTGYTSSSPREITLRQVELEGVTNAMEGTHYSLVQERLNMPANAVYTDIPIVLYKENLAEKTSYFIALELVENNDFKLGELDKLSFKIEFSSDILRPSLWSYANYEQYYWGTWSYNKHLWMITQTKHMWDDEFFTEVYAEPGLAKFWREKLNELLAQYNANGGVLVDDDGIVINGFPN